MANLTTAGIRYDHDLTPKLFAFGAADFMSNALQYLDLRQVYTGGLGFHAIKNDNTILDFLGGVNYTHETYSNGAPIPGTGAFVSYGMTNRLVALTLGEELNKKLGKSTVLTQNVDFYPDLQKYRGEYRFTFSLGHGDEDQQMVRVAEPVRRHLRFEPAGRREEERCAADHGAEHFVHAAGVRLIS